MATRQGVRGDQSSLAEGLFTADLFTFLQDLRKHNDRTWFAKNKERYLDAVQEPALEFVRSFGPYLRKVSANFVADDRPSGGSLFRIYRDVRFSKDKSPYKTHVGLDFRHRVGKDVHTPSFFYTSSPARSSRPPASGIRGRNRSPRSGRPSRPSPTGGNGPRTESRSAPVTT
jgi:hypothetical protein